MLTATSPALPLKHKAAPRVSPTFARSMRLAPTRAQVSICSLSPLDSPMMHNVLHGDFIYSESPSIATSGIV